MASPKITSISPAQQAMLAGIRDEWIAHGLSTEPADRQQADTGLRAAYLAAGLKPPQFVIWLGSPFAGAIAQAAASQIINQVRAQVDAQVRAQVDDRVDDQVDDQVHTQVHDQVRALVHDQVDAQVRAQVYDQVRAQVDAQVDDRVHDQVYDRVRDQVHDRVHAQVDAHVRDQVHDQVYAQVRAQVDAQVYVQVDDQVDDQVHTQVHDQVRVWYRGCISGHHWAGYYASLAAMSALGVTGLGPINGQMHIARSAGWWWPYRNFAVITDRPCLLERDNQGRLHNAEGMAIRYRDGWGFHAWHGRPVPAWVIESPTLEQISAEPNVEIRRCGIESMGWEKFTSHLLNGQRPAVCPDPGNTGQDLFLYEVPERLWGVPIKLLLCTNGSPERDGTRRRYGLTVPGDINDPLTAAAWTAGLTKDEYTRIQRRT